MPVSHDHRCVFVHIPKTGGTSIEHALRLMPFFKREDRKRFFGKIVSPDIRRRGFLADYLQHLTSQQIDELDTDDSLTGYFRFSIVRNPFDRIVSSFFRKDGDMVDLAAERGIELEDLSFDEYVEATAGVRHSHMQTQHEYVMDRDGQLLVDYLGRFETLEASFQEICGRLGVKQILRAKRTSPDRDNRDYRVYYSDTSRRAVEDRYARDLELFGYKF